MLTWWATNCDRDTRRSEFPHSPCPRYCEGGAENSYLWEDPYCTNYTHSQIAAGFAWSGESVCVPPGRRDVLPSGASGATSQASTGAQCIPSTRIACMSRACTWPTMAVFGTATITRSHVIDLCHWGWLVRVDCGRPAGHDTRRMLLALSSDLRYRNRGESSPPGRHIS